MGPKYSVENNVQDYIKFKNEVLSGKSSDYLVKKVIGSGFFGIVVECVSLNTLQKVAVKIVRKDIAWAGKAEVAILKKLSTLDPDRNNLLRFNEHFKHNGHVCLVFEMLDISLYDYMEKRSFQPLSVSEIRIIAQQMLVALNALKSKCVAHIDIKPDNIMLVDHLLKPFKLKLVDFGLAIPVTKLLHGSKIQVIGYRAPEVILGLPLNEAVDMWALGCVLAFLYLGEDLYPTHSNYEVMRAIVQMQGYPDDHLLDAGIFTKKYFSKNQDSSSPSWLLNTQAEHEQATGYRAKCQEWTFEKFTCLDDMVTSRSEVMTITEYEDTQAFLSLLKHMLHLDPEKRITPSDALGHRFITTKHLNCNTNIDREYVRLASLIIKESQLEQPSVEFKHFVTSSEVSWNALSITTPELAYREATPDNGDAQSSVYHTDINNEKSSGNGKYNIPLIDGSNSSSDEKATGFVEVKSRKKWFKRIQGFFSRVMKSVSCCGCR